MRSLILFFVLLGAFSVGAQIDHPRISPLATVQQKIGLANVKVTYSRPGARGRKIMGELVPYGRIWRVGANESTKFTVDMPVSIQGNLLKAGTYALYAFPAENLWEFAFHANTSHWGDGRDAYNPAEDVFRIEVIPEQMNSLRENFLIAFDHIDHRSMDMILEWENTRFTIAITVDTDSLMRIEIENQLRDNPSAQTYYEAARYFQEQGTETMKALDYIHKAIELGGETYYFFRVKSLLEAYLGQYQSAIESASISLELAESLGKDEFVRLNQGNIQRWKALASKSD